MDSQQTSWIEKEQLLVEFDRRWSDGEHPDIESFVRKQPNPRLSDNFLIELIEIDLEYQWKRGRQVVSEEYLDQFKQLSSTEDVKWTLLAAEFSARSIVGKLPQPSELQQRFESELETATAILGTVSSLGESESACRLTELDPHSTVFDRAGQSDETNQVSIESNDRVGRYRLIKKIGSGTFATVWRATDSNLDREVAIKILKPERMIDANVVRRMVREAKAAAQLEHPTILKVFEVGSHRGLPFIVTQLIQGETLAHHLAEGAPYSDQDAAEIIRDIARGIHFAHCEGIIHRDIKPANILMVDQKTPIIADFGLAYQKSRLDQTLTISGDILGTPAYMSPEQAIGAEHVADSRTDVYSLGALLFQMLTGRLPFGGSVTSVIHKVIHSPPPSLRAFKPSVPLDLETIALKCLEKSVVDRYESAKALADDLDRFLDGNSILARPIGPVEKMMRWARKRPKVAALSIATLLLVCFLAGSLVQLRTARTQKQRAEKAEQQTQRLLAKVEGDAGLLAMQRGHMHLAIRHFQDSQSFGGSPADTHQLELLEAFVATRQIESAIQLVGQFQERFDEMAVPGKAAVTRSKISFWRAVLALENGELENSLELFVLADDGNLTDSDKKYCDAMRAVTTTDAIDMLTASVAANPLSHHARRMLCWLHFSLSAFDELEQELDVAGQLFPHDVDFGLLHSLLVACRGSIADVDSSLKNMELRTDELNVWRGMCVIVNNFVVTASHKEGINGFDDKNLKIMARSFVERGWPALKSRGMYFPPRIAMEFEDFFDSLNQFSQQDKLLVESLASLVDVHPEPSLLVLLSGQYLSQGNLKQSLATAERSLNYQGFVKDSHSTALQAVFATSLTLHRANESQGLDSKLDYLQLMVDAIVQFENDPELIKKYSTESYGTPVLIGLLDALSKKKCTDQLPLRWLARIEAAGKTPESSVLWIKTVVALRTENWVRAVSLCERQLEIINSGGPSSNREAITNAMATAMDKINRIEKGTHE